jgi:hypothetical protein
MNHVYLFRLRRHDQGTEGQLLTWGFNCYTLELPWRQNQRNISSIPAGDYDCIIRRSPRFGLTYWVLKVPGRTYILIHGGNWAGDKTKGFKTHVAGCILLGKKLGYLQGQRAILNSRVAVRAFMNHMENKQFKLHIIESF